MSEPSNKYQIQTFGEMAYIAYSVCGEVDELANTPEERVIFEPMDEKSAADALLDWLAWEWDLPLNDHSVVKTYRDGDLRLSVVSFNNACAHESAVRFGIIQ